MLLLVAAIGALALATYSPADPVLELVRVANRAGAVGATLAGVLIRGIGLGSVAAVGAIAVLGARLILGMGVPGVASRFWLGAGALAVGMACAGPTLTALFPTWEAPAAVVGGLLGDRLFRLQSLLLSIWGAALVNVALLSVGLLCATGVSSAAALRAIGVAVAAVAGVASALVERLADGVRALATAAVDLVARARAGLREGVAAFQVWREQRARQRRAAAARRRAEAEDVAR
ncbi:MAG: DNA translocase FtsK 4TM domain-containing protein, partial [Myxococcales bacterium]|nr:DNA translocase FtsK 4TM domain-containing protein [Myxococcales bacterium]